MAPGFTFGNIPCVRFPWAMGLSAGIGAEIINTLLQTVLTFITQLFEGKETVGDSSRNLPGIMGTSFIF